MAKRTPTLANPKDLRTATGANQSDFWKRFGVTQSGGSRYESGRNMPTPLKVLVQANIDGIIDEATLAKLVKKVGASSAKTA